MSKVKFKIIDGGKAIPIGNNLYKLEGRSHEEGGIGIELTDGNAKTIIEAERKEIFEPKTHEFRIFSDSLKIGNKTPAQLAEAGYNPDIIFKAQQNINGNYGGNYAKDGLIKKLIGFFTENNEKENTNKENKKDAPIDWDEIKIKQAYTESGFNSKAVSKAPAYGLYQITPQTLKEFNDKTGNTYKLEDLYNDKINTEIRDWYMNDLYNREWNTKNNPSDSVRATKTIMAYNMGPTNLVNRLNELKAKGYDIYQSLDWVQDDSIPVESREYNDFILRNINNSIARNQLAYEASKKKNSDKVEGIRKGFKIGGVEKIKNVVRKRLANNLHPGSYDNIISRIIESVILNKKSNDRIDINNMNIDDLNRYALFSKALYDADTGVKFDDYFEKSKYIPTKHNNDESIYYSIKRNDNMSIEDLLRLDIQLGDYKIDKGNDDKGNYYSIYDIWDINPLGKQNLKDFTNITQPIEIYDRVYENDNAYKTIEMYYNTLQRNKLKNGGQINMKLKNKNKQDITDIVMNEILPHSTGERKKFIFGGSEWSLVGNAGLNLLSGLGQGIAGSINASKLRKMYDGLKRQSTFIPVAREHINTKVDVEPQLNLTAQTEYNLRRNAEMNTSNSKVARQQARAAALDRIRQDNAIYSDKYNRETQLRNAEAELQTKYNLVDLENKLTDIREQNDFDMQKAIGKANAGTMEAQTWGNAIASTLGNTATSLMDYATMKNDLLKSNNKEIWDKYDEFQWGMYTDGVDADGKPILKSKYTNPNHPLYNSKHYKRVRKHFGIS